MNILFSGHDMVALSALAMAVPVFLFGLALGIHTRLDRTSSDKLFW
ncbi:hypothetical protein [Lichenicoccus roseus]|nr:hypothetical protein [Lichenicoccus roseus]